MTFDDVWWKACLYQEPLYLRQTCDCLVSIVIDGMNRQNLASLQRYRSVPNSVKLLLLTEISAEVPKWNDIKYDVLIIKISGERCA